MARKLSRSDRRKKVRLRIRPKVLGTPERPRLYVFRSLHHMYAQLVDDQANRILASVNTQKFDGKAMPNGANIAAAKEVGKGIAGKAKNLGIKSVVFDRSGYIYRGRVMALAEAAREAGLKF